MTKDAKPPILTNCKSYDDWVKLVGLWKEFTSLEKSKQALAIVLSLEDKAQEAALEIPSDDLKKDEGVDLVIKRLDKIFKKDELSQKFSCLESFESYRRPESASMRDFVTEFEKKHYKIKSYKIDISDDILGFRLLKAANLSTRDEQLVKATITDIKYEEIKSKLTKIFSEQSTPASNVEIKSEPSFYTQQEFHEDGQGQEFTEYYDDAPEQEEDFGAFYTNYRQNQLQSRGRGRGRYQYQYKGQGPSLSNWRKTEFNSKGSQQSREGRNPIGRSGMPTRCVICQSINHWAKQCPDKQQDEHSTLLVENQIVLHQNSSDSDASNDLKSLVAETWSRALLDCGASKTVCGKEWFKQYKETLPLESRNKIVSKKSVNVYRFGDGERIKATESVIIPATIGNNDVFIITDIVENDIPLLLSRSSMKKANMKLNFETDTILAFGCEIPLITTTSGHYAMAICKTVQTADRSEKDNTSITLTAKDEKSNAELALKLHRQFAHPPENRLLNLINNAGHPWSDNGDLKEEIKKVSQECQICKRYKRPPPRPIVGLPTASRFQETVALDLKFYNGRILLHMIDHATRLSGASIIPNKNPETVIKHMFQHWISVYGSAASFLSDNGGEFINQQFIELCEQLGIRVKTTAAESPWSNGLIERHNLIIADMMDKVIDDTNCSLEIAVAWCVNAKNSLQNIHGFSPYQLAIGCNPKLPSAINGRLPALTNTPSCSIIKENLDALHRAREAFVQAECSEKIKRALSHNVRTSGDIKYTSGDAVYYKRKDNHEWHGPAKVLGQDGQQILLKHGGVYIRVHPCRLQLTDLNKTNDPSKTTGKDKVNTKPHNNQSQDSDESGEDEPNSVIQRTQNNDQSQHANSEQEQNQLPGNQNLPEEDKNETPVNRKEQHDFEQIQSGLLKLKPNLKIKFQEEDKSWTCATTLSRAGKATGKNAHWWNIRTADGDMSRDMSKVSGLQEDVDQNLYFATDTVMYDTLMLNDETEVHKAKLSELQKWKEENVFTEVENEGQPIVSLRWVIQSKTIDGRPGVKARLCARGFEEEKLFRTDSPTCSREGLRVALTTIASMRWKLNSIDVRTAFLQGKEMQRTVFVRPPKESNSNQKLWKLNKCVYGLYDASRYWYLKLKEELVKLGATVCALDQSIFLWLKLGKLIGIMVCFVDDVLWGGVSEFKDVIVQLKLKFKIGTENQSSFRYIGIDLQQQDDFSVIADQKAYIAAIKPIPLTPMQKEDKQHSLDDGELKLLRMALGQLNWIAGLTRPEISYYTCELSTHIKKATIADIISTNKVIKFVKSRPGYIKFSVLDMNSIKLEVWADASWNNLPNGGSQGGQIIFMSDQHNLCSPLYWNSTRLKRVARSTLAAESLSVSEGCDSAYYLSQLVCCIMNIKDIKITAYTDNQSLFDTAKSTKQILDKRLRVEMSAIREMCEKEEIELRWVESQRQLSNVLTKKGASSDLLRSVLQEGSLKALLLK